MASCAGCGQPIYERFLLNVIDKTWHPACVSCSDCKMPLAEKCFSRDGRLYCKNDFVKRYGTKCSGCDQVIAMNDLVRRARDKVFHVNCFTCTVCQKKLDTGDELYILNGHRFMCKKDYLTTKSETICAMSECGSEAEEEEVLEELKKSTPVSSGVVEATGATVETLLAPSPTDSHRLDCDSPTGATQSADESDEFGSQSAQLGGDENSSQGGTKRRGPRTTIKAKQLETLKTAFNNTPKPTRHIREQLAQETGLNMRVIQVWFQNRRSKERRMKQLRYGSFRPGSRRSRAAREETALIHASPSLFQDGMNRPPDYYQPNPMGNYYCDMFGPGDNGHSAPEMGIPPPGYMIGAGDNVVAIHHEGGGDNQHHFMMEDGGLRPQSSPDMPLGAENVFRPQHGAFGHKLESVVSW